LSISRLILNFPHPLLFSGFHQNSLTLVSTVSIATRLQAKRSGFLNPASITDYFIHHNIQSGSGAHLAYSMSTRVLSWGKQSGHEVIHSPSSNVKVKNEWSYTSTPPTCLHYVSMGSFIFTINNLINTIPVATIALAMKEQPVYSKQQTYD